MKCPYRPMILGIATDPQFPQGSGQDSARSLDWPTGIFK